MRIIADGPKVFLVGTQQVCWGETFAYLGHAGHGGSDWVGAPDGSHGEVLCEAGGRVCYDSFTKRRPGGAEAYFKHIIESGHGRVLEHAVFSFIFADISRACSHELYAHVAGWSKSMRSTRYVDESLNAAFVLPPALKPAYEASLNCQVKDSSEALVWYRKETDSFYAWKSSVESDLCVYRQLVDQLYEKYKSEWAKEFGCSPGPGCAPPTELRKKARQAARYCLPHSLATTVFATVNARALRQFFESRASPHADAEIRQLANRVYEKALPAAPLLFADYTGRDLGDGTYELITDHRKV